MRNETDQRIEGKIKQEFKKYLTEGRETNFILSLKR